MPNLRVPSVQHLARNWRISREAIAKALIQLALDPPRFSYNPLYAAVHDLLVLNVPYDHVVSGIRRSPREKVRKILLEVLPLIRDHFDGVHPDYYQSVEKRYYPVGRGLMVPFQAPMIYGVGGERFFPWFSFWRSNPLASEKLSLFVTVVSEIMMQDPDLEFARFEILDFSCPPSGKKRELRVINANDVPRLNDRRKKEMLEAFADGYFAAQSALSGVKPSPKSKEEKKNPRDSVQADMFD